MSKHKLDETQRLDVIKAFQAGVSPKNLRDRFDCDRKIINRVLTTAGLLKSPPPWSDNSTFELKKLILAGELCYADIAAAINAKFGTEYSKESISGKVHRLGIAAAKKPAPTPKPKPVRHHLMIAPKHASTPLPKSAVDNSDALNVALVNLEDGMCKWPTGDATYCGHETIGRRVSYCVKHHNAGTEPAKGRGVAWWKFRSAATG